MFRAAIPESLISKTVNVKDSFLHYLEAGTGNPIVFLHGNPTSSYLWRNVIPHVEDKRRCLALDLIGMGASGKPDTEYRLTDHINYVEAFIGALALENITLVLHDWGVAIGFTLLRRHPERIRAVAFLEGHLGPIGSWNDWDEGSRELFQDIRTEGRGERLILEENLFVETVLPSGIVRELSEDEMAAYRAPFPDAASRRPILREVRDIPIEGEPEDVQGIMEENQRYLTNSDVPKLLLYAHPGAIIGPEEVAWCRDLRNLTAVDVGEGLHFLPEDRPGEIGRALRGWLEAL